MTGHHCSIPLAISSSDMPHSSPFTTLLVALLPLVADAFVAVAPRPSLAPRCSTIAQRQMLPPAMSLNQHVGEPSEQVSPVALSRRSLATALAAVIVGGTATSSHALIQPQVETAAVEKQKRMAKKVKAPVKVKAAAKPKKVRAAPKASRASQVSSAKKAKAQATAAAKIAKKKAPVARAQSIAAAKNAKAVQAQKAKKAQSEAKREAAAKRSATKQLAQQQSARRKLSRKRGGGFGFLGTVVLAGGALLGASIVVDTAGEEASKK